VEDAGPSDVYCLDVPLTQSFAVGSGVLAHNCTDALRYLCVSGLPLARTETDAKAVPKEAPPPPWMFGDDYRLGWLGG
jgi:hypothetical protein